MADKIIRSLCLFSDNPSDEDEIRLMALSALLESSGFVIQTRRLVTSGHAIATLENNWKGTDLFIGAGTLSRSEAMAQLPDFLTSTVVSYNLEIQDHVTSDDVNLLFEIMRFNPSRTFNFSYTFHNAPSTPFFPAAHYERNGFAVGLQPTDLAEGCSSLHTWLYRIKQVWDELVMVLGNEKDFLGIDSSIAPMYSGDGSFINLMKRIHGTFTRSVTTDSYVSVTRFIKEENPAPLGLCGLMFPCLEDFELTDEYEKGEFPIERNIFLSLHSGLGIDTYPVGIDEDPQRIRQILNLLLALAYKYHKPLSARFVSDGVARIGDRSDFRNPYLKDVIIRPL